MAENLRQKTRRYMDQHGLSAAAMAERVGVPTLLFTNYLYNPKFERPRRMEAALIAYFQRDQLIERQKQREFLQLKTSALMLERCEEARLERELAVLYGPPGISKTYSLREYVRRRAELGDHKVLLITANSVTTPRSLILGICRQLALPSQKQTHTLVEDIIEKLLSDPHLLLVDEANHLNVAALELLRHLHDMAEVGMVLVGTKRLYDLFTNGGRKSQDLEQLWSRVGIQDLLPGLTPAEVRQITRASLDRLNEAAVEVIERMTRGSVRRLAKLIPRLRRLQQLNPDAAADKLVKVAAGQIIA